MADPRSIPSEDILQWLWESLYFDTTTLETTNGKGLTIFDPGRLNPTDGPDFVQASIGIEGLRFHGDIELHLQEKDWKQHGHHTDGRYNSVILHVFIHPDASARLQRPDGTILPALNMYPYLPRQLTQLIGRFHQSNTLPCAGHYPYINREVYQRQLERAHHEYFESKTDTLLAFYPAGVPLKKAWKQMVATALFDGLGISHNRRPMRQLCTALFEQDDIWEMPAQQLSKRARQLSGLHTERENSGSLGWNHKQVRPGNHPKRRVPQAAQLLHQILRTPVSEFLHSDPETIWNYWLQHSGITGLGDQRSSILFGTVFLPSVYLLGSLGASTTMQQQAYKLWKNLEVNIPKSLLRLFKQTGFEQTNYRQKLGAVYQLRTYCRPHQCHKCEILKSAIDP